MRPARMASRMGNMVARFAIRRFPLVQHFDARGGDVHGDLKVEDDMDGVDRRREPADVEG